MKNFDQTKFLTDLKELNKLNHLNLENVNGMFNAFQNKFTEIIDRNAPYKTLSKKESKLRTKPWITKCILQSIKMK